MAICVIEEFRRTGTYQHGVVVHVSEQPSEKIQTVTFSTATQSSPFSKNTKCIRIQADSAFHYEFGENPTATTSHPWVLADEWEYFQVTPGHVVSVVVSA